MKRTDTTEGSDVTQMSPSKWKFRPIGGARSSRSLSEGSDVMTSPNEPQESGQMSALRNSMCLDEKLFNVRSDLKTSQDELRERRKRKLKRERDDSKSGKDQEVVKNQSYSFVAEQSGQQSSKYNQCDDNPEPGLPNYQLGDVFPSGKVRRDSEMSTAKDDHDDTSPETKKSKASEIRQTDEGAMSSEDKQNLALSRSITETFPVEFAKSEGFETCAATGISQKEKDIPGGLAERMSTSCEDTDVDSRVSGTASGTSLPSSDTDVTMDVDSHSKVRRIHSSFLSNRGTIDSPDKSKVEAYGMCSYYCNFSF